MADDLAFGWFGLRQVIEISPMSGISNVRYWLRAHGCDATDESLCDAVFEAAKTCDHTFTDDEVYACSGSRMRVPVFDQEERP